MTAPQRSMVTFNIIPATVFAIVMLCWFTFAGVLILRRQPASAPEKIRDRGSMIGLVLQGLAYAIVWAVHREMFSPVTGTLWLELAAGAFAIVAAFGSVILISKAIKTLGKEWSVRARMIEGHQLATKGPYAYVRHPIYTGMLGMLLATGLAISYWWTLLVAVIVFFVGTLIRIHSEENLLRETFGQDFENYSRQVPAIIPGVY